MKLIICFLTILLLNFCGRGPSEDRGKTNCRNQILFTLAVADDVHRLPDSSSLQVKENGNSSVIASSAVIPYVCSRSMRDSLLERYYRGYVDGKE